MLHNVHTHIYGHVVHCDSHVVMEYVPDEGTLVPKRVELNKVYYVSSWSTHILFKLTHDQITLKLYNLVRLWTE